MIRLSRLQIPDRIRKNRNEIKRIGSLMLGPVLGGIYYGFILITGLSLPCPFYALTGYLCPGCGVTRMALSLGRLEFVHAFQANPILFCSLPFLAAGYFVGLLWPRTWSRFRESGRFRFLMGGYLAVLLLFGVIRNIP